MSIFVVFFGGDEMKIVIIAGKAGVGKNYLGEKIKNVALQEGLWAITTEFSKYIKLYAKEILNYDEKKDEKPRSFLQDTGSFLREYFGEMFLIKRMLEDFVLYQKFCDMVIITDVRLIKEIEEMKNHYSDIISIYIKNDILENHLNEKEKEHITEIELEDYSKFDKILENKTKEELEIYATEFVQSWKEK